MMKTYVVLDDSNIVISVMSLSYEPEGDFLEVNEPVVVGAELVDGVFVPPEVPEMTERNISAAEFVDRFQPETFAAIEAAAEGNPQLRQWYKFLELQGEVNLNSARLAEALGSLVLVGIMDQAEADAVRA